MIFTVQWTSAEGVCSVAKCTAAAAIREAERVTDLNMRNVSVRTSSGPQLTLVEFQKRLLGSKRSDPI